MIYIIYWLQVERCKCGCLLWQSFWLICFDKTWHLHLGGYSGESMENALRACCKGIKIGKILIHRDGDNGKQVNLSTKDRIRFCCGFKNDCSSFIVRSLLSNSSYMRNCLKISQKGMSSSSTQFLLQVTLQFTKYLLLIFFYY